MAKRRVHHTTKFDLAFDALEFANGNVSAAKAITAKHGDRISARTWHKAICIRLAHLTEEERRLNNVYNAFIGR